MIPACPESRNTMEPPEQPEFSVGCGSLIALAIGAFLLMWGLKGLFRVLLGL